MPDYHLVAANLIEKGGEYLLVQEGKNHVRGKWNFPAGSIEEGEKAVDAAVREASEEAGVEVSAESFIGAFFDYSDYLDATVVIFVIQSSLDDIDLNLRPEVEEEILDARFFSKQEIQDKELRTPFITDSIEIFEEGEASGLENITDYR